MLCVHFLLLLFVFLSVLAAGASSVVVGHPLDTVKVFQSHSMILDHTTPEQDFRRYIKEQQRLLVFICTLWNSLHCLSE